MLALSTLSADWTAFFYTVAFVAAVVAAALSWPWRAWHFWVAVALAAFLFVQAWDALAVT